MTEKEINKYKEKLKKNIEECYNDPFYDAQKVFALSIQALLALETILSNGTKKGLYNFRRGKP